MTPRARGGRRRAEAGAAAVELALVLPFLAALVLGSIDFGYFFFVDHVVTNAAREGARAGTLWPDDARATADATQTARSYLANGSLDPSRAGAEIAVTFGTVGVPPASSVRVRVSYPVGSLTGFTAALAPKSAISTAEMRRQ